MVQMAKAIVATANTISNHFMTFFFRQTVSDYKC